MLAQLFNQLTGQPQKSANPWPQQQPPPYGAGVQPYGTQPAPVNSVSYWGNPAVMANTPPNPAMQVNPAYAADSLDGVMPFGPSFGTAGAAPKGSPHLLRQRLPADYGVNKPLSRPMFLGYHHDKPMYVGEKLFISC